MLGFGVSAQSGFIPALVPRALFILTEFFIFFVLIIELWDESRIECPWT